MDAAIASSFVISVVRPQSTGIGGGGFMLWSDAATGEVEVFDFRERAPLAATETMFVDAAARGLVKPSVDGHLAVATPGLVAGLHEAHRRHGKLAWAALLQPAIDVAENGFPVYAGLADAMKERREILGRYASSRAIYLRDSQPLALGDTLVQADLAWTLRQIAERGAKGFYEGPVRELLLAEMRRGGGLVTAEDLAIYRVRKRAPVEGVYRGRRIVSMPPPSSGGIAILEMLNMLAGDNLPALGRETSRGLNLLAETMRRAFADRARWLGDTDFVFVPVQGLLSPAYAQARRRSIDPARASRSVDVPAGEPDGMPLRSRREVPPPRESPSTTHLSVMDSAGNAVATTQTVNYSFGSCVVAEGTGVVLNDEMDDFSIEPGVPNVFGLVGGASNAVAPLKTMLSSMSPTFVYDSDGKLVLALGSPGGPRIISATLQTILNVVDFGLPLPEAVAAPRIHHQWQPDKLRVEKARFSPTLLAALRAMGHEVDESGPIGDVQAVARNAATGVLEAASDPRSEGEARAY